MQIQLTLSRHAKSINCLLLLNKLYKINCTFTDLEIYFLNITFFAYNYNYNQGLKFVRNKMK